MSSSLPTVSLMKKIPLQEPEIVDILPESNQFPIDPVIIRILTAYQQRKWVVPGIEVQFSETKTWPISYRSVSKIEGKDSEGEDFTLLFSREVPGVERAPDIGKICAPRNSLEIFSDESGPIFTVYAGNDWESDRQAFIDFCTRHAKQKGNQQIVLRYSRPFTRPGKPQAQKLQLVEQEYIQKTELEKEYLTNEVFEGFASYLEKKILPRIEGR